MSTIIQRNFSGGELSPSLHSRVDLTKYATGLRTERNAYTLSDGGLTNRAGTKFIAEAKGPCRLIEWIYSDELSYILELGENYMRFHRNGAQVETGAVAAHQGGGFDYEIGDLASYLGVNYYCVQAHQDQQPPNTDYWYPLTGTILELPTPWTYAQLSRLQFVQSADVTTFVHGDHFYYELTYTSATHWALVPNLDAPYYFTAPYLAPVTDLTNDGTASTGYAWFVTVVYENGEESEADVTESSDPPTRTLSWSAVTGAVGYNVYRQDGAGLGFLGFTTTPGYVDYSTNVQDPSRVFRTVRTEFDGSTFPSVIGQFRQRLLVGNLKNPFPELSLPEDVWGSRIGAPKNFNKQYPIAADGSLRFPVKGRLVNEVRHIVDNGSPFIFTSQGEVILQGDANGNITPTEINPTFVSYNGASYVPPIVSGANILYVQAQGQIVRDLGYDIGSGGKNGIRDGNLSLFARHLTRGKTILGWAYQKNPDPIIRAYLDDGSMIALTYDRPQEIVAWHTHDTDGDFESIASIPEGGEYYTYVSVGRTINGVAKRYIERFHTRAFTDSVDAVFMDCSLSYDGRNSTGTTMTLSGSGWTYEDTLTLTASASFFVVGDVGNEIWITGTDGIEYRCAITAYTSATVVSVKPDKTIPVGLQAVATTNWAKAVDEVSGLSHLEAKEVSVIGNGYVISSPNSDEYGDPLTVTSGAITLPACYSVIHVGLPYISDVETLDIDTVNGETLVDKKKLVNAVTMHLQNTRGLWIGGRPPSDDDDDPLEDLTPLKIRENEEWGTPTDPVTDVVEQAIRSEWNSNGRVFIRQVDPLPMTILSIAPSGLFPFGGK